MTWHYNFADIWYCIGTWEAIRLKDTQRGRDFYSLMRRVALGDAARAKLQPTVDRLQASALELSELTKAVDRCAYCGVTVRGASARRR